MTNNSHQSAQPSDADLSSESSGTTTDMTIVGIGASAGGLTALKTFFGTLSETPGVAIVVVVHLSPEHESHLAELLQPHCGLPIQQVAETTPLEIDRVYVIPPGANLSAIDTHLRLSQLEENRRHRAPIDHFFRTLADTHDGHSVGVILTGTGSDGTLGLRRIKEQGGLTIAQTPEEADYDGMPRSAIASGMVDLVLPLRGIAAEIVRFARTKPLVRVPAEDEELDQDLNRLLQKVFAQVRARTGHDFSDYKRSTVMRRIQRRMQLHHVQTLQAYLEILRGHRDEARDLFNDLLITVTEFFRDRQVFERLRDQVIPRLFAGKTSEDRIRVWSVGCSTGEEAYSLAMLLLEQASLQDSKPLLQVFASDLHERSLERAREGIYPEEIGADVSPERLRCFFTKEPDHYRVRREVREMVVFAPHNLLRDPPFSHLDLLVCRNLLIYLQRDVQQDVMALFHYALNHDGLLLLGTSESVDRTDLFMSEDKEVCLFRRRNVTTAEARLPVFPLASEHRFRPHGDEPSLRSATRSISLGAMHAKLIEQFGPPSILINRDDQVLHCSANAGAYLSWPHGEPTNNLFKLIREPLKIEMRAALHAARSSGDAFKSRAIAIELDGRTRRVILRVHRVHDPDAADFLLVMFDELPQIESSDAAGGNGEDTASASSRELDEELQLTKQRLQSIIEEYETGREAMQASNEELQSANEELRSTMEELETSKEELQSMNEELATLNQENRHRVEELSQLTGDLQNLLAATDIATLFLDRELRIVRFTPQVGELFNVRLSDRGRPLGDLTHRLGYPELQSDAQSVLDRLIPIEREVEADNRKCYLTRLLPYRREDRIEGVVITFIDISRRKLAEDSLKEADRQKDEFLAMLSHELRNPLAPLSNGIDLISLGDADKHTIELMQHQVSYLTRLVDDLLDVSRIIGGKIELRRETISLRDIFNRAIEMAQPVISNRKHLLTVAMPSENIQFDADPMRVVQAITNLLVNSAKYTAYGGEISLSGEQVNGEILIRVRDNGAGIPADILPFVFDVFRQGRRGIDRAEGGLGIGLTIVKRVIQLHGGDVEVHSGGENRGSEFTIHLPTVAPTLPLHPARRPATTSSAVPPRRRVLVVDDNKSTADIMARLLAKMGDHELRVAYSSEEALSLAQEFAPHLLLLDIGLPRMDGFALAQELRKLPVLSNAVFVAATGYGTDEDRRKARQAGFDEYLVKPIELDSLANILSHHKLSPN